MADGTRDPTDDDAELEARVDHHAARLKTIQETLEDVAETQERMLPSRRQLLTGTAAAVGAASLAGGVSASGHNDGDTQWGSSSNRDDYVVDHIDANSIGADQLSNYPVFFTPSDGQFHAVTESNLKSLITNYTYIQCPAGGSVTIDTPITLTSSEIPVLLYANAANRNADGKFTIINSSDTRILENDGTDTGPAGFYGIHFHAKNADATLTNNVHLNKGFVYHFENCFFQDGHHGLHFDGIVHSSKVVNCRFSQCGDKGIHSAGSLETTEITGNFFGEGQMAEQAINLSTGASGVAITNNTISLINGTGIVVGAPTTADDIVYASGNNIHDPGGAGINLSSQDHVAIGNRVDNPAGEGIRAGVVLANLVQGASSQGIVGQFVAFNHVDGCADGVNVGNLANPRVVYNRLINNSNHGITAGTSSSDEVLESNLFSGNTSGAIDYASLSSTVTRNGHGQEAAGTGNAPTAGNFDEGNTVENTDDGTVWLKARDGTMIQLA